MALDRNGIQIFPLPRHSLKGEGKEKIRDTSRISKFSFSFQNMPGEYIEIINIFLVNLQKIGKCPYFPYFPTIFLFYMVVGKFTGRIIGQTSERRERNFG